MTSPFTLQALACLLAVIHGLLWIRTGRSAFYWLARLFDSMEAAQGATLRCMGPWIREWVRAYRVEYARLRMEEL